MADTPKDFANALKAGGLDEFFFRLHGSAPAGLSQMDCRGKTAGDKTKRITQAEETARSKKKA
jgi:hypothetical protein